MAQLVKYQHYLLGHSYGVESANLSATTAVIAFFPVDLRHRDGHGPRLLYRRLEKDGGIGFLYVTVQ